jgi:hypothetical protein
MSPVLPFDIVALIVDIAGENNDTNLLMELALVSHSFHQICSKHIFATVELHDTFPISQASSVERFVKLLESSPDVVKYIRKLTYNMYHIESQFRPSNPPSPSFDSSPVPNLLRTISCLNYLKINVSSLNWSLLNPSLTSAFLHLMHLPTINHIDLSNISSFPLSSFTPSVNLHRLDIHSVSYNSLTEDNSFEILQSGMMPILREFHTSRSHTMTTKLFHARGQDGQPAFNFKDLRVLSMPFERDEWNIRHFLPNAELLEKLHLLHLGYGRSLVELHDILTSSARALKVLDLTVSLYNKRISVFLGGICEELEALAGHNMLEALFFKVCVYGNETLDFIGSIIQEVEKVLVKPGWSALRKVSFKVYFSAWVENARWSELLQSLDSLPDKYLSHLSKLDSVAFNYSAEVGWPR